MKDKTIKKLNKKIFAGRDIVLFRDWISNGWWLVRRKCLNVQDRALCEDADALVSAFSFRGSIVRDRRDKKPEPSIFKMANGVARECYRRQPVFYGFDMLANLFTNDEGQHVWYQKSLIDFFEIREIWTGGPREPGGDGETINESNVIIMPMDSNKICLEDVAGVKVGP